MKILDILGRLAKEKDFRFLLVGGFAVNSYGDRRQTVDIDILIKQEDRDKLKSGLRKYGYEIFNDTDAFLQFKTAELVDWPIDCIVVDEQTFNTMIKEAKETNISKNYSIFVPSAKHLVAMKLHSMKQAGTTRGLKDLLDIVSLVKLTNIDFKGDEFKELCLRYVDQNDYEQIIEKCAEQD